MKEAHARRREEVSLCPQDTGVGRQATLDQTRTQATQEGSAQSKNQKTSTIIIKQS